MTVTGQSNLTEIPQSQMSAEATSYEAGENDPNLALDGDPDTHWHTRWFNVDPLPQSIMVNLGGKYTISKLGYLPRPDEGNGTITAYNVYTSTDGVNYTLMTSGNWLRSKQLKEVNFAPVEATHIKLEAVKGVGEFASAAEITVYQVQQETAQVQAVLSADASVTSGKPFVVRYDVNNISGKVFAQDFTIQYDADRMDYVSAKSLIQGVAIVEETINTPGKLRLIMASEGAEYGLSGNQQIAELTFQAKEVSETVTVNIRVSEVLLGDEDGTETTAAPATISVKVKPEQTGISGDLNGDGKVSIGDLGIVAAHYGKDSSSPDWQQAKRADMNGDGKIDITDLAQLAKQIVTQ